MRKPGRCGQCGADTWCKVRANGLLQCGACEVERFFANCLTLTADYAGKPFVLMPWTRDVLRDIFGTYDNSGLRLIRDVYLEVPKKNSKTTVCAGLVLYCLACSETSGTEVYSAATSLDQANIVFRAASQMVKASPILSKILRITPSTKRIVRVNDPTSFYTPLSADGDVHDGIQPSFVVRDELHRWRARKALELNEILERGTITRTEPLVVDITTAGEVDESPLCWRRHEYARMISEGVIQDRRFYGRTWSADLSKCAWDSKEARVQANPSHEDNGGYLKDEVLADMCVKAQNDPQAKSEYLRYHLNVWGQRDERAIDMEQWYACGGGVDMTQWPEYDEQLLIRKWGLLDHECWAGVDASWATDLTAISFLFPPASEGEPWSVLLRFVMPEEKMKRAQLRDKVPYLDWSARGFITPVSGSTIDDRAIKDALRWGREMFDLRAVAYDPWNFKKAAAELTDEGFQMGEVRQGYASLGEATKRLLRLYVAGELRHGNNPVLNWNASCLALQGDNKDNVQPAKPERARSSKRIDGISATVTAMALAGASIPELDPYSNGQGVRVV